MDPTDWQYTHRRQWESLDPRHRTDSREKTANDPYCRYSVNDKRLHTMKGTNAELEQHNPSSHMSYILNSNNLIPEKATDPDGEPVELSNIPVDGELARKWRELQQIEKQISLKKATIALKKTESFFKVKTPRQMFEEEKEEDLSLGKVDNSAKKSQPFMSTRGKDVGFSYSKWSSNYDNRPLNERVNVILQQRCPGRFLAKAFSTPYHHLPSTYPVEKKNMPTLNKDDHPLKLRVKALMNRRHTSGVLDSHGEVPVVKPHPPSQSSNTTVVGNDLVVKGFQRFLNVLNKVEDIEVLTNIVNGDNELAPTGQELLHSKPPVVKEKSDICKSESQRLQRGAGQRDRRSCSKERKTERLNQDLSNGGRKRNIQPEEKSSQSDDTGGCHFVSSSRSRSPPVVEEKKPKLDQHQEDLQNILKTIGFSLDADDMCKLAERTQERLYGIKHDTKQRLDSTRVNKKSWQHVQRDHSNSGDGSPDPHPSPEDPEHHVLYPSAAFAIPTYTVTVAASAATATYNSEAASAIATYTSVQPSAYHSYCSNSASSIAWNYGSTVIPPPSCSYLPGFCNSVNDLCTSANIRALPGQVYPHAHLPAGPNKALGHSGFNVDLSLSEGQTGQRSGPQYLHIINTEVEQKKIATPDINTQTSSGTAFCLPKPKKKKSTKGSRRAKRRERENKLAQPLTDVQEQMPTRQLRSGIKYPTNTLHPQPPVEASTEVQQKTATQLTEIANTEYAKYNLAELKNAAQELFQEKKRLKKTAKCIQKYIARAKSNRAEYCESKQQSNLKCLLKKQQKYKELREENKLEVDMILCHLRSKSSTEAQQLEGELSTEEEMSPKNSDLSPSQTGEEQGHASITLTNVNAQRTEVAGQNDMAEMTLVLSGCSSENIEKGPAQMGKSNLSSGITTNNLYPELSREDESKAGQMEGALPTEQQIKAGEQTFLYDLFHTSIYHFPHLNRTNIPTHSHSINIRITDTSYTPRL